MSECPQNIPPSPTARHVEAHEKFLPMPESGLQPMGLRRSNWKQNCRYSRKRANHDSGYSSGKQALWTDLRIALTHMTYLLHRLNATKLKRFNVVKDHRRSFTVFKFSYDMTIVGSNVYSNFSDKCLYLLDHHWNSLMGTTIFTVTLVSLQLFLLYHIIYTKGPKIYLYQPLVLAEGSLCQSKALSSALSICRIHPNIWSMTKQQFMALLLAAQELQETASHYISGPSARKQLNIEALKPLFLTRKIELWSYPLIHGVIVI